MTLQSLKNMAPKPEPAKKRKIELKEIRRASRKEKLMQASAEYAQTLTPTIPVTDEVDEIDLTLDGLYVDEGEGMKEIGADTPPQTQSYAQAIAAAMKKPLPNITTMTTSTNPIVNAVQQQQQVSTYNPLGGSCITSTVPGGMLPQQNPYASYYMYGVDPKLLAEQQKQQKEREEMYKRHYRSLFMSVKPEDQTEEEWRDYVEETIKRMFPDPEEVKKKQEYSFMGYEYDENFRRVEETGVKVVKYDISYDENGKRIVKEHLLTEPNDPETGTHKVCYTRSYDIAEYQMQVHFYDTAIRAEQEQIRQQMILKSMTAPDAVRNSTYSDRLENGYMDPALLWYYKTYEEAKYKRWRKRMECGTLLDPREYGLTFYKSGIDPNVKFDMNTMPTLFADRNDVKLAYDYQNNPNLYDGGQVTSYLTNKLRIDFENRKRQFLEKIASNNLRVDYNNEVPKSIVPQAPIVGTAPILPDQNGVIMGLNGQALYDPNQDLVAQLTNDQQSALLEYNVNSELARLRQMGEMVDESE